MSNLSRANLDGTILIGADLKKANLSETNLDSAILQEIDLSKGKAREQHEKVEPTKQNKTQEINHASHQPNHEQKTDVPQQEIQRLEIEQRRLEVLEKRLEVQKKGIEYALEIACRVVDTLHLGVDPARRAIELQKLLSNLIQFQNGKGLELVLSGTHDGKEVSPSERRIEFPAASRQELTVIHSDSITGYNGAEPHQFAGAQVPR